MAAKMMRIAGRGADGLAKAIKAEDGGMYAILSSDSYERRRDEIIDIVGVENFAMFFPFDDGVGSTRYQDLINRDTYLAQPSTNYTAKRGGPFGYYLERGSTSAPLYLDNRDSTFSGTSNPSYAKKYATRLSSKSTQTIGSVTVKVKKIGTLSDAKITARIYSDDAGKPGTLVSQYNFVHFGNRPDEEISCSTIPGTDYVMVSIPLCTGFPLSQIKYKWLVLEYVNDTGVDASNHLLWAYGADVGGARAVWDGTSWVVTQDESFAMIPHSEQIQLPEDATFVVMVKEESGSYNSGPIFNAPSSGEPVFQIMAGYNGLGVRFICQDGTSSWPHSYRAINDLQSWSVVAVTFHKYKSPDNLYKSYLYQNGVLLRGINDDRNTAVNATFEGIIGPGGESLKRAGSYNFGRQIYAGGTVAGTAQKFIGPLFVAKRALSREEIAKVSRLMLGSIK